MTMSTEEFNKEFILSHIASSLNIQLTYTNYNIASDYIPIKPAGEELKFIQYLLTNFDTNDDKIVDVSEVSKAKELNIPRMNIKSLDGVLDKMPEIEKLDCSNNNLSSLDLSNNEHLYMLDFSGNPDLQTIKQAGLLLAGTRWSIINVGATST